MKKMMMAAILVALCSPALAAPKSGGKAVICQGSIGGAHTLMVGNCSFTGDPGGQVYKVCNKDDVVCRVEGFGRHNGEGVYIMSRVDSVRIVKEDEHTSLSTEELEMAQACKKRKACSLTCNRASEAGREDLIKQGACAE